MKTVGAYEAKTNLSALLDEVANGETITITKHGVPVAMLVPPQTRRKMTPEEAVKHIRRMRQGISLGGLTIREMMEEGRK